MTVKIWLDVFNSPPECVIDCVSWYRCITVASFCSCFLCRFAFEAGHRVACVCVLVSDNSISIPRPCAFSDIVNSWSVVHIIYCVGRKGRMCSARGGTLKRGKLTHRLGTSFKAIAYVWLGKLRGVVVMLMKAVGEGIWWVKFVRVFQDMLPILH